MIDYLSTFNPPQRAAVEYCDGPSLVIAGAGSGKTRVLTYKIAHLIEHGYEPWSILALTFTNKAANEMKQRIVEIVGQETARQLWMGTFHSVLLRILRIEHESIGFPANFTIYDTDDSKSLIKSILKEMELDDKEYKPGEVLSTISNSKNNLVTAEEYVKNKANLEHDERKKKPALAQIFLHYANRCRQANAMDFDDILLYTYLLFESHPEVREKYEKRFKYVLVDEYQDTNFAQHQIVWQLTERHQHVCVVGDDAQSIYAFRGANIDNILTFNTRYTNVQTFKLERNYRSTQNIVDAANSLIRHNNNQIQKKVFSKNDKGEPLHVFNTHSDIEEGSLVINNIKRIKRKDKCEYSDFVILYRTNAQSRVFEDILRKEKIPYKIYGGLSFYQRKEVKDVLAYFRLAVNPYDEEAFKRVYNYPTRGIGTVTLAKIIAQATHHNTSFWNVISNQLEYDFGLTKSKVTKLQDLHDMLENFGVQARTLPATEAGMFIIRESGIMQEIFKDCSVEGFSRQKNLEEMINSLQDFYYTRQQEDNANVSLSDFLSEVSLLSDMDTSTNDDEHKVTLMTIHSSKGLEFSNVFVVGLEEGLFPSTMALEKKREMEEERRLFYVAITRAKQRCFLSCAQSRYRYGEIKKSAPSRFLTDIDSKYLDFNNTYTSAQMRESDEVILPWHKHKEPRPFTPTQTHKPTSTPITGIPRYKRIVSNTSPASSAAAPVTSAPGGIVIGKHVEHERFGHGTVLKIEGQADNIKATIAFEHVGTKQLLLKYAKLKVLD